MVHSGKRETRLRATKIEFRLRMAIMVAIITIGYCAPWIEPWGIGSRVSLLGWLAHGLARTGLVRFAVAVPLVIVLAALVAAVGAVLRVWGTAYLGPFTVNNLHMKAGAVLADGPYRFVRNPLYLGSWCMFAAMAFLMPVSGALFAMVLLTAFLLRLILAEEAFLTSQRGEPYLSYMRTVPRLFPRLRNGPASTYPKDGGLGSSGRKPQWLHAILAELCPIGVFLTLALLSWSYDNSLMIRGVLVSFGVSLVARALLVGRGKELSSPE
jgi:protein-S-isoprenylcysteine O-methyltransferase Ste14